MIPIIRWEENPSCLSETGRDKSGMPSRIRNGYERNGQPQKQRRTCMFVLTYAADERLRWSSSQRRLRCLRRTTRQPIRHCMTLHCYHLYLFRFRLIPKSLKFHLERMLYKTAVPRSERHLAFIGGMLV